MIIGTVTVIIITNMIVYFIAYCQSHWQFLLLNMILNCFLRTFFILFLNQITNDKILVYTHGTHTYTKTTSIWVAAALATVLLSVILIITTIIDRLFAAIMTCVVKIIITVTETTNGQCEYVQFVHFLKTIIITMSTMKAIITVMAYVVFLIDLRDFECLLSYCNHVFWLATWCVNYFCVFCFVLECFVFLFVVCIFVHILALCIYTTLTRSHSKHSNIQ